MPDKIRIAQNSHEIQQREGGKRLAINPACSAARIGINGSFFSFLIREITVIRASPKWLRALNVHAAAKVATALERVADGNLSNVKAVGNGVLEHKIDFGPGYRIYFGRDGDRLIILLAGGTKKRQQEDIRQAKANWEDYRNRKT